MNSYRSSAEQKALSKEQLFGNYGTMIGAGLIVSIITGIVSFGSYFFIDSSTLVGYVIYYAVSFIVSVIFGLFTSGKAYIYLKLICGQSVLISDIFQGFRQHSDKALMITFFLSIINYVTLLPMLLLSQMLVSTNNLALFFPFSLAWLFYIIVAIATTVLFAPIYYLLHDFPNYSVKTLFSMSIQLMKGHKGRYFYLIVSFLPLMLLGILSCCVANLWLGPYFDTTRTNFYMDLMKNRNTKNTE